MSNRILILLFFGMLSFTYTNAQVSVGFNASEPSCKGIPTGSITASPTGGASPYTFAWSSGQTTQTISNILAGEYTVTVTDSNGLIATGSVTLTEPDEVTVSFQTEDCIIPYNITAVGAGGVGGPFTYKWGTGDRTASITVSTPGDYCVTVTDANSCGRVACITVDNMPPSVEVITQDVICADDQDGSLTAQVTGGQAPFTYAWSNGETGATIGGLSPGTFTVSVTDANGCTDSASGTVSAPDPMTALIGATNPICLMSVNGSLTANVMGGTMPYSYVWSNGETTATINGLDTGTYRVTITDASGCSIEEEILLESLSGLQISVNSEPASCPGVEDGSATVSADEGVSPYTYMWSNGAMTASITDVAPGSYQVTVMDAVGCSQMAFVMIEAADPLDISISSTDASTCGSADGTATVVVDQGTGPFTYLWSNGETTASVSGLGGDGYQVTVTDANECFVVGLVVVNEPPAISVDVNASPTVCDGASDGAADAVVTGGTAPLVYAWSTGEDTPQIGGLAAGTYIVTVTDANGCTAIDSATVVTADGPQVGITASTVVCGNQDVGTASANVLSGGQAPFTYQWSTNEFTSDVSGLSTGTYSVTVTDANGCFGVASTSILVVGDIILDLTPMNAECNGEASASAVVGVTGGTAPYTYLWSDNDNSTNDSLMNVVAGIYTVTVTDANGCDTSATVLLSEPQALELSLIGTDTICEGEEEGIILAEVMGGVMPYDYAWSTGDTTSTIDSLPAGVYTLTVTDANQCEVIDSFEVIQTVALVANLRTTEFVCGGGDGAGVAGEAEVRVQGGAPPYTYTWNTGDATARVDGLPTGEYSVTISDALGCTSEVTGRVNIMDALVIDDITTEVNCAGDSTGSIVLTISGGMAPYTYEWSDGSTDSSLVDITAGFYAVTVTDDLGCTEEAVFLVLEPDPLVIQVNGLDVECADLRTSEASVAIFGGIEPYSIEWSNGETTDTITEISGGTYTVTVTDANECITTGSVTINDFGEPSCLILVTNNVTNPTSMDGALEVLAAGGMAPYQYLWSTGETTAAIDGLGPLVYSVTVTDAKGCTSICEVNLAEFIDNAAIGDYAWYDANRNGIQDDDEHGVEGIPIIITPIDDGGRDEPDTVYTDMNGRYIIDVEPGKYKLTVIQPDTLRVTSPNIGDDEEDSDFDRGMLMTDTIMIDAGETDLSWDVGFVNAPGINITDPCNCLDNATTSTNGQFGEEVVVIEGIPGDNWVIIDQTGMYLEDSPEPPALPISVPIGTPLVESTTEPGIFEIEFRHVDEAGYDVTVSNGFDTLSIGRTCFYPEIVIEGLPADTVTVCINDAPFFPTITPSVPGIVTVFLNDEVVTEIDPRDLGLGDHVLRVELEPFDPQECTSVTVSDLFVVNEFCPSVIGDYVWFDENKDGIQDPDESGVPGIKVVLTPVDVVDGRADQDTAITDENGRYFFDVLEGFYKITFCKPDDLRLTLPDVTAGGDTLDSDVDQESMMTPIIFVPPGSEDLSFDAGLIPAPGMVDRAGCACLNNATDQNNGQFEELLTIEGIPGDTWEVIIVNNAYDVNSPEPPASPTPLTVGTTFDEVSPGVFELRFRHVDGETYEIMVTNGIDTLSASKVCEYPGLDIDIAEALGTICLNDPPFIPDFLLDFNASVPGELRLTVNGIPAENINPGALGLGIFEVVATLTPTNTDECQAVFPFGIEITNENCPAKIGDFVWLDLNEDGIQDPDEPGIADVEVTLSEVDGDNFFDIDVVVTDENGEYCFEVSPGDYKLTFERPENTDPTSQDAGGDDSKDSDVDPDMLMTGIITVGDGEVNLSIDAGFIQKCINVGYPGEIAYPEMMICAPGNDPAPIISIAPAIGGVGEIEYLWMYSESSSDFDNGGFTPIPNSNSLSYDPGPIDVTTHFARCVRIVGCDDFLEANIVTVLVKDNAKAEIDAPDKVCYMSNVEVNLTTKTDNPIIKWEFPGGVTYDFDNKKTVNLGFNSFGSFTIKVTVTENGCKTTSTHQIIGTAGAEYCAGVNFNVEAEGVAETQEVRLKWETLNDGTDYRFEVQHSPDGIAFNKIAEVYDPLLIKAGYRQYEYIDQEPKKGRNLYRVKMMDDFGAETLSNLLELMMFDPGTQIMLYPNPVQDKLMVEFAEKNDSPIEIELISTEGLILRNFTLEPNTIQQDLDMSQYPGGIYFLRIKVGTETTEVMRIMKKVE